MLRSRTMSLVYRARLWLRPVALLAAALTALPFAGCKKVVVTHVYEQAAPGPAAPDPLVIAAGDPNAEVREITVDARAPRTSIGRFRAGDRVNVRVIEGQWTYAPGAENVGPAGLSTKCKAPAPHRCAAGEDAAPGMGMMLFAVAAPTPPRCTPTFRHFIPNGVETSLPEGAFLFLAPNDWEDSLADNAGAIDVEVEIATSKTAPPITKRRLQVESTRARTLIGQAAAGQLVRVSVLGGSWTQDLSTSPKVDASGVKNTPCSASGTHACPSGDGMAPLMGLVFLMARCEDGGAPAPVVETKAFIGAGATFVSEQDGEVFLGPNDWEDGCHDNGGFMRVEITTVRAKR